MIISIPGVSIRSAARAVLVLALLVSAGCTEAPAPPADPATIILVRHAEKADDGTSDPPLTEGGAMRSETLAQMLADAQLTHLHTTDYQRTRQTLAPLALQTGLTPALYDPRDLEGFSQMLCATPGVHVVSGHSNTTPELVDALGGTSGAPIEENEYDRLYVLHCTPDGPTLTTRLRMPPFGLPAP